MAGERFPHEIVVKGCTWVKDRLYPHMNCAPYEPCMICGECSLPNKDIIVLDKEGDKVYIADPTYDYVAIYRNEEAIEEEPVGCGVVLKHKVIKLKLEKIIPYNVYQLGLA